MSGICVHLNVSLVVFVLVWCYCCTCDGGNVLRTTPVSNIDVLACICISQRRRDVGCVGAVFVFVTCGEHRCANCICERLRHAEVYVRTAMSSWRWLFEWRLVVDCTSEWLYHADVHAYAATSSRCWWFLRGVHILGASGWYWVGSCTCEWCRRTKVHARIATSS